MYKLLTSIGDEYESSFVRNQGNRDSQLKGDHIAAQRGHMYMMVKMSDLFGFVNDLEKIIYGLGFKLILKRNNNDRALFRVNANPGAVANDGNIEIRDISWCVPSIDFYKNVPNATNFLFDLGMESSMERPQYIIVGFENNNVNEQTHDASAFDIMNVIVRLVVSFIPRIERILIMVPIIIMRLLKRLLALIKIIMGHHII